MSESSPRHNVRRGFTLVELLLVLVILATLAVVVVPKFTGQSRRARITAAKTGLKNIETAITSFEIQCSRFPTSEEGLNALVNRPADLPEWQGPYLPRGVPKDPWRNPYIYVCPGQHNNDYDLSSAGPDGEPGTEDDINNWSEP